MSRSELEALYIPLRETTRLPPMRWSKPRDFPRISRRGMFLWGIAGTLLILLHAAYYYWSLIDDAFISFRYAENLVRHGSLVFNVDEPTEGYSNLLWTLQNALAIRLGAHPMVVSRWLGIASWIATLWWGLYMVRWSARRMRAGSTAEHLAQGCLAWLIAASSVLGLHSQSGLETVQNAFLLGLGFGAAVLAGQTGKHKWGITAAIGMGLALLSRPENFGFLPLWLIALLMQRRDWRGNSRKHLWSLAAPFIVLVALTAWRLWVYHAPLPLTVTAKGAFAADAGGLLRGLHYVASFFRVQARSLYLPCLIGASLLLAFSPGLGWSWRLTRMALGFLLLAFGNIIFAIEVGGDFMQNSRLLAPLVLPCAVAIAWGVLVFTEHSQKSEKLGVLPKLLAVFLILCCGWVGFVEGQTALYSMDMQSHIVTRSRKANLRATATLGMQQWTWTGYFPYFNLYTSALIPLGVEQFGPGQSVAAGDIGILGYALPEVRIIDTNGLVTGPVARFLSAQANPQKREQRLRELFAYLDAQRPEWLWLYDREGRKLLCSDLDADAWPAFKRDYEFYTNADEYTGVFNLDFTRKIAIYRRRGVKPLTAQQITANYARLVQALPGNPQVARVAANWQARAAAYVPFEVVASSPILAERNRVQLANATLVGARFLGRFDQMNTLDGWTTHGTAFENQPRIDPIFGQQPPSFFIGPGYVNSFHPSERETATGYAESPAFDAQPGEYLLFWLAGGTSPQTGVELWIDGKRTLHWSGYGHARLTPILVNLTPYAGHRAAARIVDDDKSAEGWVTADHFVLLKPTGVIPTLD